MRKILLLSAIYLLLFPFYVSGEETASKQVKNSPEVQVENNCKKHGSIPKWKKGKALPADIGDYFEMMDAQCCEGLIPRAQKKTFDVECMVLPYTGYYGICLACGDGVCDAEYETQCNCPEDCVDKKITDQDRCIAQGGVWGRQGEHLQGRCNLPTKDAGRICRDGNECEGECIAELTKEQFKSVSQGAVLEINGRCSEWTINLGCLPVVSDGKVPGILCMD